MAVFNQCSVFSKTLCDSHQNQRYEVEGFITVEEHSFNYQDNNQRKEMRFENSSKIMFIECTFRFNTPLTDELCTFLMECTRSCRGITFHEDNAIVCSNDMFQKFIQAAKVVRFYCPYNFAQFAGYDMSSFEILCMGGSTDIASLLSITCKKILGRTGSTAEEVVNEIKRRLSASENISKTIIQKLPFRNNDFINALSVFGGSCKPLPYYRKSTYREWMIYRKQRNGPLLKLKIDEGARPTLTITPQ